MRAPAFWQHDGVAAALLAPLGAVYAAATARRVARPGWQAPVPVLCCGNATAGGAGKTTLALDIGARLRRVVSRSRSSRAAMAGGRRRCGVSIRRATTRPTWATRRCCWHRLAPTYVAADREAGARAAAADGAQALVMDDGLQNPTLAKTLSLLVVDGAAGFGNGRVIPAGPLREPVAAAAARCQAAVLIGADRSGAARHLPPGLKVLRATLQPAPGISEFAGRPALAFAGIGFPEKFFAMLEAAGVVLAGREAFPDHHRYTKAELERLLAAAARRGAVAITTPKDAARLSTADRARVGVVGVRLVWDDEAAIAALLAELR